MTWLFPPASSSSLGLACPVLAQVVQSLSILYHEGADLHSGQSNVKFAVSELRGDWKWQQETSTFVILQFCGCWGLMDIHNLLYIMSVERCLDPCLRS